MYRISRRELFRWSVAALPAARAMAQQEPTFSSGVNVVSVQVTARDNQGQIVRDLRRDEFIVEENGKPQAIRYFAQRDDLPLTLGLLVDISGSQRDLIAAQKQASLKFLNQVMREGTDHAFVVGFDRQVDLVQNLTSSRSELQDGLAKLATYRDPNGHLSRRAEGTSLYGAIFVSASELMNRQEGRKALIIITDGVDTSSAKSLSAAISECQRADTLAYGIRAFNEQVFELPLPAELPKPVTLPDGRKTLTRISRETGAAYFELAGGLELEKAFATIEEELRNQYSLGYTPVIKEKPGFRKIRVSVKRKGTTVRT